MLKAIVLFCLWLLLAPLAFGQHDPEEAFLEELLYAVRTDLRASVFITDYYVACLKEDADWIKSHGSALYREGFCEMHLEPMLTKIEERLPKMRSLMGLSQWSKAGDSRPMLPVWRAEAFSNEGLSEFVERNIEQPFKAPDLDPLTNEEVLAAASLLRERLQLAKTAYEKGLGPSVMMLGGGDWQKEALGLIVGDSGIEQEPAPILAYLTKPKLDREDLIAALVSVRQNTQVILKEFEDQYFEGTAGEMTLRQDLSLKIKDHPHLFQYDGLLTRLKNGNPEYEPFIEQGEKTLGRRETWIMAGQIGGMVGWAIGCQVLLRGLLSRGLCELPIGLGANAWFIYADTERFNDAMEIALYRADGSRPSGKDLNELNDLRFSQQLSILMLPFFTGVPKITRAIRN